MGDIQNKIERRNSKPWSYASQLIACALVLISLVVAAACARIEGGNSSSQPGSSLVPTPTATATEDYVFKIEVQTSFEGTTETTTWGTCTVPATATASTAASGTVYPCSDITIPEIELYYSDIHFVITSAANTCKLISFRPYYYLKSVSNAYVNPAGTTVDCTANPTPIDCYGGVGTQIIPAFPNNGGVYFLTAAGLTQTFTGTSANTQRQQAGPYTGLTNRWVANNAGAATRAAGIANELEPGSMLDYRVVCSDSLDHEFMTSFVIRPMLGCFRVGHRS
jgi:hypothetical protein